MEFDHFDYSAQQGYTMLNGTGQVKISEINLHPRHDQSTSKEAPFSDIYERQTNMRRFISNLSDYLANYDRGERV